MSSLSPLPWPVAELGFPSAPGTSRKDGPPGTQLTFQNIRPYFQQRGANDLPWLDAQMVTLSSLSKGRAHIHTCSSIAISVCSERLFAATMKLLTATGMGLEERING